MPDVQEVFRMATQKVRPEPGFVDRQFTQQRRRSRNRKVGALAIAAALGVLAVVVVIRAVDDGTGTRPGGEPTETDTDTTQQVPILPDGTVQPGRYLLTPDPSIDASYTITMEVPEGYEGGEGAWVLKPGTNQTGLIVMTIADVHADACQWRGTRTAVSSTDEAVAALASQTGIRSSTPIRVLFDGFFAEEIERTIPAGASLSECDALEFRTWVDTGGWPRYLGAPGQSDFLWIVDVDGVPLVIDVATEPGASAQDRTELMEMAESIQIDPR